jgi:hypothetical protein
MRRRRAPLSGRRTSGRRKSGHVTATLGTIEPAVGYLSGRLRNLAATPAVSAVPAFGQVLAALRGTRPRALVAIIGVDTRRRKSRRR